MPNFLIYPILLTIIVFYTQLDDNTLLSSHPLIYILLHTESALIVLFLNLQCNVYLVFLMKSTVMVNGTKFNKKQVGISLGFVYIKYKV